MKRHLLFILVSLFAMTAAAQDILLDEQFNDGTLGVFTEYSVIGDGQMWIFDSFMDDQFAEMNGFDGGIQDNEDWLISPALDMDLYEDEVLTFETASNFDGPDLELLVSNDYDGSSDPNTATWTNLSDQATWSAGGYEVTPSGSIDLSGIGGTGYIAFKYVSNTAVAGKLWQVDSVVVQASILSNTEDALAEAALISTPVVREGQLQFNLLNAVHPVRFELCSLEGRTLQRFTAGPANSTIQLPVGHLPKGVYVLVASSGERMKGHKVVLP